MRKIWLVIKFEVKKTLLQRSFWVMTFLMPAILLAFNAYAIIKDNDLQDSVAGQNQQSETQPEKLHIGLVDESGLIEVIPPGFPSDQLIRFPDKTSALAALQNDEIDQYILIPAQYLDSGQVIVYDKNFQILEGVQRGTAGFNGASEHVLAYMIDYNLTKDEQLALAFQNPTPGNLAEYHAIRPRETNGNNDREMAILVSTLLPYIYYFLLLIGSSYLMRSVVAEKENRTVEVLLLSMEPKRIMIGKILGLGVVILVQLVVWVGGGVLTLNRSAQLLSVSEYSFSPGFFLWALVFLVLGYLLYGSIMAAAGALARNAREAGQVTWLLIIPLMPTLMFGQMFFDNPDGGLVFFLSVFPFSSPSAMVTRLAVSQVPAWQVILSLVSLLALTYVFIGLAARFFKSGNLLSDTSFKWRRLILGWRD